MRSQKLIDLESRLLSPLPIPVIGQCLQKKAVIALSKDRSPEAAKLLAKALTHLKEPDIKESILDVLSNLKNQNCIDAVCEVWADTRHRDLANLLVEKGWIASEPIDLRVITALKIDRLQIIMDGSKKTVEPLLNAFQDKDSEIANRASKCAIVFDKPEYQEFICRLVIEQDHPIARQIAIKAQYLPNETSQKALFCFFTEQWDKYESLDAELSFLQKLFERGSKELRQRIAEQIKKANRAELLKIITGKNQERKLEEITDTEWETILFVLNSNKQWNTIWQLARKAPTIRVKSLLQILDKEKWLPKTEEEEIDFVGLKQLSKKCSEQLPMMGGLTVCKTTMGGILTVCKTTLRIENRRSLFSPDGKLLVTYFPGDTILWQMPDGKLISTLPRYDDSDNYLVPESFSSDGQLFAGSSSYKIVLWQMPEGKPLLNKTYRNEESEFISASAFSPDGKIFATKAGAEIKLWQMPKGKLIATLNSPFKPLSDLTFSPDGKTLVGYGEYESLIVLWRMPERKLISTINTYPQKIKKVVFSPDSQLLASSGSAMNPEIKLWRTKDGQLVKTMNDHANATSPICVLKFSPDSQFLICDVCRSLMLWRIPDGKLVKIISDFDAFVMDIDFYPDGKILITGDDDGTIKLFQMPGGEHIATPLYRNRSEYDDKWKDGICHINLSPDGQTLVSCSSNGVVKLWKSDLFRLINIPVANLNQQDKDFIKKILSNNKCTKEERHWLELIQALTNQS